MPEQLLDLSGKTIVVTGGRGFLGRSVVEQLERTGAAPVPVSTVDYDLTEQSEVRRMFAELRPDGVVHAAAAVGGIGANVANPGLFLYANALMGLMVLEEARRARVRRFVLVSTSCTYPEDAPLPLREEDLWNGPPTGATGPYGMAKRLLHEACRTYRQQYDFDSAVLLLANLFGPGDDFSETSSHVIPALVRRYVDARDAGAGSVMNWGTGNATREVIHVDDAARAIVLALERGPGVEPINVGTGEDVSIRELADTIQRLVGYEGEVQWDAGKPEGIRKRYFDTARAKQLLGFEARISLSEGLAEVVAAYEAARALS